MNISEQRQAILEGMAAEVPRPCDTCAADYPDIECDNAGPSPDDDHDQTECCALQWHVAEKQLAGLHDNGAVLKVEGEPPTNPYQQWSKTTRDGEQAWQVGAPFRMFASGQLSMTRAGYGPTAPLIEPEKPH